MKRIDYWEDYTTHDKNAALFTFLRSREAGVWHVLGKDRQNFWKRAHYDVKHTTKDFDGLRNDLFDEFINKLPTTDCKAKLTKLFTALRYLGTRSDWEKMNRKEYKL